MGLVVSLGPAFMRRAAEMSLGETVTFRVSLQKAKTVFSTMAWLSFTRAASSPRDEAVALSK